MKGLMNRRGAHASVHATRLPQPIYTAVNAPCTYLFHSQVSKGSDMPLPWVPLPPGCAQGDSSHATTKATSTVQPNMSSQVLLEKGCRNVQIVVELPRWITMRRPDA